MISLPHPVRVFLHTPATDLRKGFDALSGLVTTAFGQDPTSGHLFLFVNRRRDRIKILYWDRGDGLAIWYKRLEVGSFQIPATATRRLSRDDCRPNCPSSSPASTCVPHGNASAISGPRQQPKIAPFPLKIVR